MKLERWKLHLSVALMAIAAMILALTPAVADPVPDTDEYPDVAFLARNDVPFDAQTAASMAAQLGAPMFITNPNALSDAAANGISDLNPDVIIVAGGEFAISEDVANAAAAECDPDCTVDRRFGAGRDQTAAALAGIAADYGFDRPVLQGSNHVAGDVHVDGTVSANAITVEDTGLVPGLNADQLDGMDSGDFALSDQTCASGEVVTGIAADGTPICAADQVDGGNAESVDGFDANALVRSVGAATDAPTTTSGVVETVDITAPTNGFLVINAVVEATTSGEYFCRIFLNGAQQPETGFTINVNSGGNRIACPVNMTVPVTSGTHTVDLDIGNIDTSTNESSLSVLFVPFGADGTQPTP